MASSDLTKTIPYRVPVYHPAVDGKPAHTTDEEITVTVNFDALARLLGAEAVRGKTGKIKKVYGAVVVQRAKAG